MSYILVYYKPCSYELHSYRALFYNYGLTVTNYDNRHERDLCGKSKWSAFATPWYKV